VPRHWTGVSATGGIGWDFRLGPDLALAADRPTSRSPGVERAEAAGSRVQARRAGRPAYDFLGYGHLDAWGLGGSVMLRLRALRPEQRERRELRYTAIRLQSYGSTAGGGAMATARNCDHRDLVDASTSAHRPA